MIDIGSEDEDDEDDEEAVLVELDQTSRNSYQNEGRPSLTTPSSSKRLASGHSSASAYPPQPPPQNCDSGVVRFNDDVYCQHRKKTIAYDVTKKLLVFLKTLRFDLIRLDFIDLKYLFELGFSRI